MMTAAGAAIRRYGLVLIAAGAGVGILLPDLASATRPWLLWISIVTMLMALLRVEPAAFGAVLRQPRMALLILAWVTFGVPLLIWLVLTPILPPGSNWLAAAVLIGATPALMSAAAFALLLGADAALLTVVAIPSNAFAPLWLPSVAWLLGVSAQVEPWAMAERLAVLVGASFGGAMLVARCFGRSKLRDGAPAIDAWLVLLVSASAIPCMDGVGVALVARPLEFAAMFGSVLMLNLGLQALGYWLFRAASTRTALSAGLVSGTRNNVLLLAAIGPPGDSDLGLMVAAAQLTLFITPVLVAPVYRALRTQRD